MDSSRANISEETEATTDSPDREASTLRGAEGAALGVPAGASGHVTVRIGALSGSGLMPPPGRGSRSVLARQVLGLQRAAGNAAAARLLQRQDDDDDVDDTYHPVAPNGTPAEIARWAVARRKAVAGKDLIGVLTGDQLVVFDASADPAEKERLARSDVDGLSPGLWGWSPSAQRGIGFWGHLSHIYVDIMDPAPGVKISPEDLVQPGAEQTKLRTLLGGLSTQSEFLIVVPGAVRIAPDPAPPEPEKKVPAGPATWAIAQYRTVTNRIEAEKKGLSAAPEPGVTLGQNGYSVPDRVVLLKPTDSGKQYVNVWVGKPPRPSVYGQHVKAVEMREGESGDSLLARIHHAAAELRGGLDPSASVAVKGGASGGTKLTGKPSPGEIVFPPDLPLDPTGGRKVNAAAYPARLISHGPEGMVGNDQYELTVTGATVSFTMDLDFAAVTTSVWQELGSYFQAIAYRWEIIDISDLDLEAVKGKLSGTTNAELRRQVAILKAQAQAAKDPAAAAAADKQAAELLKKIEGPGSDPASGAARDIGRDLANTWEDTKADIWDTALTPGFESYMGLVAVSDVVQVGGALISGGLSELASGRAETSIGFGQEGLFILRCYAQPVITDDDIARIEADGKQPIIRAPSVAYLPIKVVPINVRAQQVNDAELQNLAALEELANHPVFPDTKEDADARLKAARDALGQNNEEAVRRARAAAEDELVKVRKWRELDAQQLKLDDPARTTDLRIWHAKLELSGIDLASYEKDLVDTEARLDKMLVQVGKGKSGFKYDRPFRPRVTLVSELDGHSYTVLTNLAEAKRSKPDARVWQLVDVSRDDPIPPVYEGTGKTHNAAIINAFELIAEKNEYGRGTIAVRMPPDDQFSKAVDGETISVPGTWHSAPGFEERAWQRLKDLATATEIASLFISGPLGVGLMVVGGVAGGLVALHNMQKRAAAGKFEWLDFQTGMDILAVVGAFLAVGGVAAKGVQTAAEAAEAARLAKRARWGDVAIETAEEASGMAKLAKAADWAGRAIHVMGTGMLAGQVITIPAGVVVQLARISQAEDAEEAANPGHVDHAKYRMQKLEVLAGAMRSILTTARMVQLGSDPEAGWDPFREPAPETGLTPAQVKAAGPERGLPADLHKLVPVEVDPSLGKTNTVRVTYELDPQTKVITRVRMRIGETATARDVELHAPTARVLLGYSGLSGRVRALWGQLMSLLGAREPPTGSRAWEAKLELGKLPKVINDRAAQLANPKLTADARLDLEQELGSLQDQVADHAKTIADMNVDVQQGKPVDQTRGYDKGKGYIAAEGTTKSAQAAKDAGLPVREGYHWRKQGDKWAIVRDDPNLPKLRWNEQTKSLETVTEPATPTKPASATQQPAAGGPKPGAPGPVPPRIGPNVRFPETAGTGGVSFIDEIQSNPFNEDEVVVTGRLLEGMDRKNMAPNYNRNKVWSKLRKEHPDLKLDTWEAAHLWGPGWGDEVAAGMMLAPEEVNQVWQNQKAEQFLRDLRDMAADHGLEVHVKAVARSQVRTFEGGVGDALLQSVEYEFSLAPPGETVQFSPGGRPRLPGKPFGHVSFSVGTPPAGKVSDPVVVMY